LVGILFLHSKAFFHLKEFFSCWLVLACVWILIIWRMLACVCSFVIPVYTQKWKKNCRFYWLLGPDRLFKAIRMLEQ
jgi:cytochrome b subunit of formate dehydrogenase